MATMNLGAALLSSVFVSSVLGCTCAPQPSPAGGASSATIAANAPAVLVPTERLSSMIEFNSSAGPHFSKLLQVYPDGRAHYIYRGHVNSNETWEVELRLHELDRNALLEAGALLRRLPKRGAPEHDLDGGGNYRFLIEGDSEAWTRHAQHVSADADLRRIVSVFEDAMLFLEARRQERGAVLFQYGYSGGAAAAYGRYIVHDDHRLERWLRGPSPDAMATLSEEQYQQLVSMVNALDAKNEASTLGSRSAADFSFSLITPRRFYRGPNAERPESGEFLAIRRWLNAFDWKVANEGSL